MAKPRKPREAKYVSETDMKNHFIQNTNKCVEIIDRQLIKLGKQAKGRTFIYSPAQVEKLVLHITTETEKMKQRLLRSVEVKEKFNVGV